MNKLFCENQSPVFILMLTVFFNVGYAQETAVTPTKGWHLEDKSSSGVYGIGLERAFKELLLNKIPQKKIIVAVIDSGIDTTHEDLKPVLWLNTKELPGNGIDDDKNGYVDDVHGWNFIGGKDGKNVSKDSYEASRVYNRFKKEFGDENIQAETIAPEKRIQFTTYIKAKNQLESQAKEAAMYVLILKDLVAKLPSADSILQAATGKSLFTGEELQNLSSSDAAVIKARSLLLGFFQQTQQMDNNNTALINELVQFYEGEKSKLDVLEKEPFPYRASVVNDNYMDINDRFYGNNDIMGPDSKHGTHVAGIIGAVRNNGKGINGIANHVEIMTIRAVPDGDEHDKDIANAIRYAVDNGAWVINMSFGKSFSPEKQWVDEAVLYAESKGVLLVHAAGNDAKNIDDQDNFPSWNFNNDTTKSFSNWINVGASGPTDGDIAASFSNYGKREVSVFAPGVNIYSTIPGGNAYGNQNGTSMASPVVAGVAALILSYYPTLTAVQVKKIIEQSVLNMAGTLVKMPGDEDQKTSFVELCSSGGIVDAVEALKLAAVTKGERVVESSKPMRKPTPKKK